MATLTDFDAENWLTNARLRGMKVKSVEGALYVGVRKRRGHAETQLLKQLWGNESEVVHLLEQAEAVS